MKMKVEFQLLPVLFISILLSMFCLSPTALGQDGTTPDNAIPLSCGVSQTGSMEDGNTKFYSLTASAGDVVVIGFVPTSVANSGNSPGMRLYDPSGDLMDTGLLNRGTISRTLSISGTYIISICSSSIVPRPGSYGISSIMPWLGSYSIIYNSLTAPINATVLTCGQVKTGSITTAGSMNFYCFPGTAGDFVAVRCAYMSGNGFSIMRLYDSTGTDLTLTASTNPLSLESTLPTNGLYTIVVYSMEGGSYNIAYQYLTTPCPASGLNCAENTIGTINPAQQIKFYSFTGTAGDAITVSVAALPPNTINPRMDLFDAAGVNIGRNFTSIDRSLTTDGIHTLVVFDDHGPASNNANRAGDFSISFTNWTTPCNATTQSYNLSVNVIGQGTVTSEPAGIACGTDCSEDYDQGSSVVLTATPSAGAAFEGWTGGECTGTDPCTVTLSADIEVSARFSAPRSVKLGPQVLMAGFDPILLDLSTTRFRITALVREGNQPIGSVSITDNFGSLAFALNLIGSLSNGDLLYGAELSIPRGPAFSLTNLFGSEAGQILIKVVDTTGLSHSFPTVAYGNHPNLMPTQIGTEAPLFSQRGCKRLLPQVLMAGFEPILLDFDDTELKVRAMVREGARPIQGVSLKTNNGTLNLAMELVETLENGDRLYEKAIVFPRGAFGNIEFSFQNLWGGGSNQFMIEVRDDAGQRHSFPDIRRGDYRTINAAECWSDQ